jgi:3-methyladenine DNA glycosylase AlkD
MKKLLRKLEKKQFATDIKKYLSSPYEFYGKKIPEIKIMAKKLHEENPLSDFYRIFNRLWNSSYHEAMSLALYTLELYEENFDLYTWQFVKSKIKEIRSYDKADAVGINILGKMVIKYPILEKEILKFDNSKEVWPKRIAIVSSIPRIRKGDIQPAMVLAERNISEKDPYIQKAVGMIIREAGEQKPEEVKRFILKHMNMPPLTFSIATEKMREIRKLKDIKKLSGDKRGIFFRRE